MAKTKSDRVATRIIFVRFQSLLKLRIQARLRDELLDGEIFYSLKEAQIIIEDWRKH